VTQSGAGADDGAAGAGVVGDGAEPAGSAEEGGGGAACGESSAEQALDDVARSTATAAAARLRFIGAHASQSISVCNRVCVDRAVLADVL